MGRRGCVVSGSYYSFVSSCEGSGTSSNSSRSYGRMCIFEEARPPACPTQHSRVGPVRSETEVVDDGSSDHTGGPGEIRRESGSREVEGRTLRCRGRGSMVEMSPGHLREGRGGQGLGGRSTSVPSLYARKSPQNPSYWWSLIWMSLSVPTLPRPPRSGLGVGLWVLRLGMDRDSGVGGVDGVGLGVVLLLRPRLVGLDRRGYRYL